MRVSNFRLGASVFVAAIGCSACSAFDPANVANADPKISYERAHQLAQDNHFSCLWAWGVDPKSGNYHCEPVGNADRGDLRLRFSEVGMRVVDRGVKLPDGAAAPLRIEMVDGKVQLTPKPVELEALSALPR